ncbi:hypothetical protein C7U92_23385 [Bradyrhizobium sp. WBOS7]|uniref:Uncharacterized protein n=1 Tax=Bradyrhizobium betae TaxID=244734 RepID=A0AAE9N6B5_9BRAD|nr:MULTISPECIES: hypothetical protein [Bradyrhizobium]MDD1570566.1 hypothetical protein [Bradyrhizobium sp. WBOS1]UUO34967.1 hypothetical protein DCK84_10625 [Bradyrhizobium sp. WBOS01]MDD1527412.1 hypothetical protein [Bradyrhizobium sp. WBOS2]MDD1579643.1 hypothetical protein [Bradyrhizobium sp. WBOS7]MDD1601047.1 hypothetical protein [Bradyrhizobium sp. WBOS16]
MRSSKTSASMARGPQSGFWQALKLSAVALGIGLVMSTGAARAGDDDEDDDMTFEEKLIDNLMSGLGAKSMEKPGIEYRERSPLVVPPKLDLPPPAAAEAAVAPNWPKDPDEKRRKDAIAARKKGGGDKAAEYLKNARPLSPAEMNAHKTAAAEKTSNDPVQPGTTANPTLSPAQLGYTGGLFKLFKGNEPESKQFTSEPPRQSLVEPPPGYQTPSPNYAYGSGPDNSKRTYFDILSGKEKVQ